MTGVAVQVHAEVLASCPDLMKDAYGNYTVQKLCEVGGLLLPYRAV
jgi:hypothetical protein